MKNLIKYVALVGFGLLVATVTFAKPQTPLPGDGLVMNTSSQPNMSFVPNDSAFPSVDQSTTKAYTLPKNQGNNFYVDYVLQSNKSVHCLFTFSTFVTGGATVAVTNFGGAQCEVQSVGGVNNLIVNYFSMSAK